MANSIELKAIITAVDKLSAPLKGMKKQIKSFKKEFSAGMAGAAALGTSVVTAMIAPIKQAIDFESTMADVRKVVDFDTPEQFKQMSEEVLKLSTKLPMAADGIGQIVAAGGQAGIAKEELMSFAESAVKMGVAFDQTAKQSGQMMAEWRTAFKLTQNSVIELADKINYLSNTTPASAQKISDIVTRVGSLAETAGVSTGDLAALGATIGGMGVEAEVAGTGIQNFMLALTNASTSRAKNVLKAIGMTPKQLSKGMVKDSRATMIKVLEGLSKLPKDKQAKGLEWLFGRESIKAIAPLLTNLDLLKSNFSKVADKQKYSGSMQKEYATRAATTANAIQLFKNQMQVASVTIGSEFLPAITRTTEKLMPLINRFSEWAKTHKEAIKSFAKMGLYLLGTATAVGVVTRAFRIFNGVMKMSPLGKLVTLMVVAGGLIVDNWEAVSPVVKAVWSDIDGVVEAIGGWETVLKGILAFVVLKWSVDMVKSIRNVTSEMKKLTGTKGILGKAGVIGAISMGVEPLVDKGINAFFGGSEWFQNIRTARDWGEFGRSIIGNSHLVKDDKGDWQFQKTPQNTFDSIGKNEPIDGEVRLIFENAPQGMRLAPEGNPPSWLSYDVGYNRFAKK